MVLFILILTGICLSFGYMIGYSDAKRTNLIPFIINDTNMVNRKRQLLLALACNLENGEHFNDAFFCEVNDITPDEYFELCEAVGRIIELAAETSDANIKAITQEQF